MSIGAFVLFTDCLFVELTSDDAKFVVNLGDNEEGLILVPDDEEDDSDTDSEEGAWMDRC